MEFIIELLFEIILEGSIELGSSKKVPIPLRILATIIILICYFGLGGFFIYMAYTEVTGGIKLFLYAVGLFIFGGGTYIIHKMFRKKRQSQEDDLWN